MQFEFDPAKSASNKEKHGIDFVEAQALWRDVNSISTPGRSQDEARYGIIGIIGGKHWVGYFTIRGRYIRIISVRRARDAERKHYEDNNRG